MKKVLLLVLCLFSFTINVNAEKIVNENVNIDEIVVMVKDEIGKLNFETTASKGVDYIIMNYSLNDVDGNLAYKDSIRYEYKDGILSSTKTCDNCTFDNTDEESGYFYLSNFAIPTGYIMKLDSSLNVFTGIEEMEKLMLDDSETIDKDGYEFNFDEPTKTITSKMKISGFDDIYDIIIGSSDITSSSVNIKFSSTYNIDNATCHLYRSENNIDFKIIKTDLCNNLMDYKDTDFEGNKDYYYKLNVKDINYYTEIVHVKTMEKEVVENDNVVESDTTEKEIINPDTGINKNKYIVILIIGLISLLYFYKREGLE